MILALVQNEDRAQRLWPGIKAVAFLSESQEPFIPSGRYARQRFSRTKECGNRIWPQIHPRVSGLNKEVVILTAQRNYILGKHRISETSKARSRCGFARAWSTHKRNRVGPYRHRAGMEAGDSTKPKYKSEHGTHEIRGRVFECVILVWPVRPDLISPCVHGKAGSVAVEKTEITPFFKHSKPQDGLGERLAIRATVGIRRDGWKRGVRPFFQPNIDVWLIFDRLNSEARKRRTRGKAQSIGKMLDGQEDLAAAN